MGCTLLAIKRILDIGSDGERDVFEGFDVIPRFIFGKIVDERLEHADTSIACRTATKSYDDVFGAFTNRISYQLACAIARGHHRVALFFCQQGETAGLSYFDDGQFVVQQILRRDRAHQRVFYRHFLKLAPNGSMECFQIALTAIADRHFHNLCVRICFPDTLSSCLVGFLSTPPPMKLVWRTS